MIFILDHWFVFSVEAFDVFCFGHLLYEISVGKPLYHVQMNISTTNNVNDASYNTAILEGNEALPNQLPDSLSKSIITMKLVNKANIFYRNLNQNILIKLFSIFIPIWYLEIILRSMISADACKDPASYPTIKSLLQDPFFNEVTIGKILLYAN